MASTLTNLSGVTLDEGAIASFKDSFRGTVLQEDDQAYDEVRKVWNGMIERRPGLIAQCVGAADVMAAVNFARENDLLVSVRGGGHNVAGTSVCEGGLMIDLTRMKGIRVDPVAQTVRAEPGLRWGEFDRETQAFGLATTGGTDTDTGIAGLTLGGGFGWLGPKFGLALDNVLSLDVVTADGDLRVASADSNPDLFFALRGGGGNFGIVTSFEYKLYPVGLMLAGMIAHPFPKAGEVIRFFRDYMSTAPDEVMAIAGLATMPDGNKAVAVLCCYNGPPEQAEGVLRPLREFGSPVMEQVGVMPYNAVQAMTDGMLPAGRRYYFKAPFLNELPDEVIDSLIANYGTVPSPFGSIMLAPFAGAMGRGGEDVSFGQRGAKFCAISISAWDDPAEDETNIAWSRKVDQDIARWTSGGAYINDMGVDDGSQAVSAAMGKNFDRLVEIKNKYDPGNLFRYNQNIRPTT